MPITRTAMIDDDGSGTTGTIINNAWKTELYNQIDALASPAWTTAAPTTITDDVGNLLANTIAISRIQRVSATTMLWQMNMNSIVLPVATPNIWLSYMPFTAANSSQVNVVALHSFGVAAYVDVYSADKTRFRVKRVDLGNFTATTHYFGFTSTWEVL